METKPTILIAESDPSMLRTVVNVTQALAQAKGPGIDLVGVKSPTLAIQKLEGSEFAGVITSSFVDVTKPKGIDPSKPGAIEVVQAARERYPDIIIAMMSFKREDALPDITLPSDVLEGLLLIDKANALGGIESFLQVVLSVRERIA